MYSIITYILYYIILYLLYNKDGKTALMYASIYCHKDIVEILLKVPNININEKDDVCIMLFM